MSRASNRYDNAKIVLFWSTLKAETELDVIIPATREEPEEAPLLSRSNLACGL